MFFELGSEVIFANLLYEHDINYEFRSCIHNERI